MKRLITLLTFLILISGELFSQGAYYGFSSSTGTYSEITGTVSTATEDDGAQNLTIPFSFKYFGTNYTSARVCTNGWLELGTTYIGNEHANVLYGTTVKPIIAGLWDDLCDDDNSDIQYSTLGSPPNQIFVVQWRNIRWKLASGAQENFQVRLYQTSNIVEIIYGTMNTPLNSPSASIGMNDFTGGPGHFLSVTPGTIPTVNSTTSNDNITSIDYLSTGLTYTFTPVPHLVALPESIDFGYTASGSASESETYLLSGDNLTAGPVVVTAPDGFEISLNGTTWFETLNVTYSPPALASTSIFVRFNPTGMPADYSGNITHTGGSASMNVTVTGTSVYNLCATGSKYCDEYIGRVQVGTIDNSTGCSAGGYGNYTSLSANMYKTVGYSLVVTNGLGIDSYEEDQCGVWVDWNMDEDINDAGESITVSGGPEVFTATITPPTTAVEGYCRLRIRIYYPDPPVVNPCDSVYFGELEDYWVHIIPESTNPVFNITPADKEYADCPLNNFSPDYFTQTFTVQNVGQGTLTINNVFLTGGDVSHFVITDPNSYPVGLSGSSTIQFTVRFSPSSVGPKATTLRIQSSLGTDNDAALSGTGVVYPPQNLSGVTSPEITNELIWDPPLPEGEVRHDNGVASDWFWVFNPSTASDYVFMRFTAPVNGNLDYVALFQRENPDAPDWDEIMVCPEAGTTNTPDLSSPIAIFADVPVNSFDGEWKILQISPSGALTAGTDFFLVAHWKAYSYFGPYVAGDATFSSSRSGYSSDGNTWSLWSGTFMMRAYMSASSGRSFLSYKVLRGTSEEILVDYATGITATNYTDAGLSQETSYFYGITALYSDNQQSDTSNIIALTTLACNNNALPYTQGFDALTAPAIPVCMTVTNDNSDAYSWIASATNARSAPNCMFIPSNSTVAMDDWFFMPPLTLVPGAYHVSFWYRGSGTTSTEKMEVKWGIAPNAASMTNGPVFDNNNITTDTYTEGTGTLSVTVAGDYYIGWHGYSDAAMDLLVVDDITIDPIYTWTGNVSNVWTDGGNWDRGSVPDATRKIIIPSNPISDPDRFPVITNTVICDNLNVAAGATITVQAPGILHITNP